jgi:hypothetical protein
MPMHYQYQISCPTDNVPLQDKPPQRAVEPQLFEAYSCVLFESLRRFDAAIVKPLEPLRFGLVLAFDTDLPPVEVDTRVRHLVSRRNAKLRGLSLVARCSKRSNAPSVNRP